MKNLQIAFFLFLVYSVLGWVLETVFWAVRKRTFANRGLLNGPVCSIYGVAVLLMSVFFQELRGNWFYLFLGCAVTASVVELMGGKILEHLGVGRWWDYSGFRFHLGGYISLGSSILWGALGVVCLCWMNPVLVWLLMLIPASVRRVSLLILAVIYCADLMGSILALYHIRKFQKLKAANDWLEKLSNKLGQRILRKVEQRLEKAHPQFATNQRQNSQTLFAQGCGYDKLFLLMMMGAFLGDLVETIFVRLTAGVWMSRSSLVWGQFSLVWGIALAGGTAMMYRYRDKSDAFLFGFAFLVGGAFEYACSVFTELAFGTVFWDYSDYPFNLGGRINLLYCFFWGIAGVVWLRNLYPVLSQWIERIPLRLGKVLVWTLTLFMVVNMAVTCCAMARYSQRTNDIPPDNGFESWIDRTFHDAWMEDRYQNLIFT